MWLESKKQQEREEGMVFGNAARRGQWQEVKVTDNSEGTEGKDPDADNDTEAKKRNKRPSDKKRQKKKEEEENDKNKPFKLPRLNTAGSHVASPEAETKGEENGDE